MRHLAALACLLISLAPAAHAKIDEAHMRALISDHGRFAELKGLGPEVLPVMAGIYESASGQTKDFDPKGTPEQREKAIQAWRQWRGEYRANL